jgi:hypothetical protein
MADVLTLALIKEYCRISHTASDNVLPIIRDGLMEFIEEQFGIVFDDAQALRSEHVDGNVFVLRLSSAPITQIVTITDTETDLTVLATAYEIDGANGIRRDDCERWSAGRRRWKVDFRAGYTAATIPNAIKLALLGLISRAYNNPDGRASESGAGHSVNWADLMDSDTAKVLSSQRVGGLIG